MVENYPYALSTWRCRGLSKLIVSRVISPHIGVTLIITLLITYNRFTKSPGPPSRSCSILSRRVGGRGIVVSVCWKNSFMARGFVT